MTSHPSPPAQRNGNDSCAGSPLSLCVLSLVRINFSAFCPVHVLLYENLLLYDC